MLSSLSLAHAAHSSQSICVGSGKLFKNVEKEKNDQKEVKVERAVQTPQQKDYKQSLEEICDDIIKKFTDFTNGNDNISEVYNYYKVLIQCLIKNYDYFNKEVKNIVLRCRQILYITYFVF